MFTIECHLKRAFNKWMQFKLFILIMWYFQNKMLSEFLLSYFTLFLTISYFYNGLFWQKKKEFSIQYFIFFSKNTLVMEVDSRECYSMFDWLFVWLFDQDDLMYDWVNFLPYFRFSVIIIRWEINQSRKCEINRIFFNYR